MRSTAAAAAAQEGQSIKSNDGDSQATPAEDAEFAVVEAFV